MNKVIGGYWRLLEVIGGYFLCWVLTTSIQWRKFKFKSKSKSKFSQDVDNQLILKYPN